MNFDPSELKILFLLKSIDDCAFYVIFFQVCPIIELLYLLYAYSVIHLVYQCRIMRGREVWELAYFFPFKLKKKQQVLYLHLTTITVFGYLTLSNKTLRKRKRIICFFMTVYWTAPKSVYILFKADFLHWYFRAATVI